MAKKQKRQATSATRAQSTDPAAVSPIPASTVTGSQGATGAYRSRPGEFRPDYAYVIKDLKRIGVLAGSFIFLLVVLSLFLR